MQTELPIERKGIPTMKLTKLTVCTRQIATMTPNARKAGGDMVCISLGYGPEERSRTRYQLSMTKLEAHELAKLLANTLRKVER